MSGRQKRALDNAPKLRRKPRAAATAKPRPQIFTCLFFVEGEADRNFLSYFSAAFPPNKGVRVEILPVSGGSVERYAYEWKRSYSGQPSVVFLFDADLHPALLDELPEECALRCAGEILERIRTGGEVRTDENALSEEPDLAHYLRDALKAPIVKPKDRQKRPAHILQALRFSPCLEGQLLGVLDKPVGTVSKTCKKALAKDCAQRLDGGQHPSELSVQDLTSAQWERLFPKERLERACERLPQLKALRRILQTGM